MQSPPLPPPPDGPIEPPNRVPMPSGLRAAIVIGIVGAVILIAFVIWIVVLVVTNPTY